MTGRDETLRPADESPEEGPAAPGCSEDELVRELLERLSEGDLEAREELFRVVASELHSVASREMRKQPMGHTLQATALMNEAYLKLFGREPAACHDKAHLLRASAQAMRQILQDHARMKCTRKRAAPGSRVALGEGTCSVSEDATEAFLEFGEEVERLSRISPDMARAMELRFILGFTMEEIAGILDMPMRTFERDFASAAALLAARMR
jgi:RNA polymerase sigma factor (TIGR02999 family)